MQKELPKEKEIVSLLKKNPFPAILNMDDYRTATDVLVLIKEKRDELEAERKSKTDPLLKEQKRIKAEYDVWIEPADEFIKRVKQMMVKFIDEEQKAANERQRLEEKAAMEANPDANTLIVPILNDIKTQHGDEGTSTAGKRWVFEVTDKKLVPNELLIVDDKTVRELIKAGKRVIPGLRIYQETNIILRT